MVQCSVNGLSQTFQAAARNLSVCWAGGSTSESGQLLDTKDFPETDWSVGLPWDPSLCFGNSVRQNVFCTTATDGVTATNSYFFICSSLWDALQAHMNRVTRGVMFFRQGTAELPVGLKSLPIIPRTSSGNLQRNYHQICAWCSQQEHRGNCQDLLGSGGLGSIHVFRETPSCITLFCV